MITWYFKMSWAYSNIIWQNFKFNFVSQMSLSIMTHAGPMNLIELLQMLQVQRRRRPHATYGLQQSLFSG